MLRESSNTTDTGRGIIGLRAATGDVGTSTGETGNSDVEPGSDPDDKRITTHGNDV